MNIKQILSDINIHQLQEQNNTVSFIDVPLLKVESFYERSTKFSSTEEDSMNYSIIGFLSRELADTLLIFRDNEIISGKHVDYFEKKTNSECDYLFGLYEKYGFINETNDDFYLVVTLFNSLAEKSLSTFQKSADPLLKDLLAAIYIISHLEKAVWRMSTCRGKTPEPKMLSILEDKLGELTRVFMDRFKAVSNQQSFNFNQFDHLFKKLTNINRKEFISFSNNIIYDYKN